MKILTRLSFAFFATLIFVSPLFVNADNERLDNKIKRSLGRGMSGADVTLLQQILAGDKKIYPEGLVTGYYGALTEKAVKQFQ